MAAPIVLVFDKQGRVRLRQPLAAAVSVLSVPAAPGQSGECTSQIFYLTPAAKSGLYLLSNPASEGAREREKSLSRELAVGQIDSVGELRFLLLNDDQSTVPEAAETSVKEDLESAPPNSASNPACAPSSLPRAPDVGSDLAALVNFLVDASGWLTSNQRVFLQTIDHFLVQFRSTFGASFAFVTLMRPEGFRVFATDQVTEERAYRVLDGLPDELSESVLRGDVKTILPDILKEEVEPGSTFFHRGLRSVVGFPALAEGKIWGFVFMGFSNILIEFTPEKRQIAELASSHLALYLQRASLREQLHDSRHRHNGASVGAGSLMLGDSPPMEKMQSALDKLARFGLSVLVTGETGVGKELAAQELHRLSPQSSGPLVCVNAAALPDSLVESELFGHAKGAFTGAGGEKRGYVEAAAGGTLFIDEVGELSLDIQAKLLRVLQDKAVTRIGETRSRPVDFRLVTATHRNLQERIAAGQFREDLFYRIAGATLHVPPLRERGRDVLLLARFFAARFAERHRLPEKELSTAAVSYLESHNWPGNVRELQNAVERAFVMAEGLVIRAQDFGADVAERDEGELRGAAEGGLSLADAKDRWLAQHLSESLKAHGGNRSETAQSLRISERTLFRYIDQLGLKHQTRAEEL